MPCFDRVIAWMRAEWQTVQKWIERAVAWAPFLQWIFNILGSPEHELCRPSSRG